CPAGAPSSAPALILVNPAAPTGIYTLSLHDALPIFAETLGPTGFVDAVEIEQQRHRQPLSKTGRPRPRGAAGFVQPGGKVRATLDRKSTRLNSSHVKISYAVFCLKKKTKHSTTIHTT